MHFTAATAIAATLSFVSAQSIRGFNTGSLISDGVGKTQAQFEAEFSNQKQISGSNGAFNSARLYTMIQGGTLNAPISAIPAAISTNTGLLLGLWASAGQDSFNYELAALSSAISQYGTAFTSLVQGISVGSEDLYRVSPTGIANDAGIGAGPDVISSYISQVRKVIAGTALGGAKVGHVDTWNAWTNSSNSAAIQASDFLGIDEYPYYQSQNTNPIEDAGSLFYAALDATQAAAGGKPVWITESGWPTTGPTVGEAVPSIANARSFWLQVYCTLPASTPVYWYIQFDPTDAADFGITGTSLSTTPLYDLSCLAAKTANSTTSSSSSSSSSSSTTSSMTSTSTTASPTTSSSTSSSSTSTSSSASSTSTTSAPVVFGGGSTSSSSSASSMSSSPSVSMTPASMTAASMTPASMTAASTTPASSMTSAAMTTSTSVTSSAGQIIGAGSTLSSVSTTATPTTTLKAATGSASNMQVYTLALLVVPALLALLA